MNTTTRGKHRQSIWQGFAPIATALLALVLLIVLTACGGTEPEPTSATTESAPVETTEPVPAPAPEPAAEPIPEPTVEPEPTPEPEPEPVEPEFTVAQEQAIGSAQDYLAFMAFSKSGLIKQLVFEGFSESDAEFAVEHIDVSWKEQALQSAKDYLDMMHFSRSGLIEQLEFEGYSTKQATYAVDQLGL
jgi:type IV secretory pathway VirB10-like protein